MECQQSKERVWKDEENGLTYSIPRYAAEQLREGNRSSSAALCSRPFSGQAPAPPCLSCPEEPKTEPRARGVAQRDRHCPGAAAAPALAQTTVPPASVATRALEIVRRRDSPVAQWFASS